jgi:hypothetical protein
MGKLRCPRGVKSRISEMAMNITNFDNLNDLPRILTDYDTFPSITTMCLLMQMLKMDSIFSL